MTVLTNNDALSVYLVRADGVTHGPYASAAVAESVLSYLAPSVREQYTIEQLTHGGDRILMG
jgi:hypothetical protein